MRTPGPTPWPELEESPEARAALARLCLALGLSLEPGWSLAPGAADAGGWCAGRVGVRRVWAAAAGLRAAARLAYSNVEDLRQLPDHLLQEIAHVFDIYRDLNPPGATVEYLDRLACQASTNNALETTEREVLANALRSLKYESTAKGARALAQRLDAGSYPDEPAALIAEAFKMRHALVHGGRRPDLERIRYVGANLERMTGDLIAGTAVARRVAQTRLDL